MAKKRITLENMADKFGPTYKEIINETNLEYIVEMGISSGLKDKGFNTESEIAKALIMSEDDSKFPLEMSLALIARANLIVNMQNRELLAKQCRLLDAILREAKHG